LVAAAVYTTVVRPFLRRFMHLVCYDVEIKTMYTPKTRPVLHNSKAVLWLSLFA